MVQSGFGKLSNAALQFNVHSTGLFHQQCKYAVSLSLLLLIDFGRLLLTKVQPWFCLSHGGIHLYTVKSLSHE